MTGARAGGLSGAFSALSSDSLAPFWNPSGLASLRVTELTSFYTRLYNLKDLTYLGNSFAMSLPFGGLGLAVTKFGNDSYRENQIYFSHGFRLLDGIVAGYNLKGMFLSIEGFGHSGTFGFDMGLLTRFNRWVLSMTVRNANRPRIGESRELIPSGISMGMALKPLDGLWISADFDVVHPYPASVKTGVEFVVSESWVLRGGVQGIPTKFSGGFGVKIKSISLDYAYIQNDRLPGHHQFSLTLRLGSGVKRELRVRSMASKNKSATEKRRKKRKLNLETASVGDLTRIKGIGTITAKKIVAYREQFGIKSWDDVLKVPGMKRNIFRLLRIQARVGPEAPTPVAKDP